MSEEFKVGKNPCPKCTSSDGFHWYGDGQGGYCFVCNHAIPSDEELAKRGAVIEYKWEKSVSKDILTTEEFAKIKEATGAHGHGVRGVPDEVYKAYGCRFEYDESSGEVVKTYYPYTENMIGSGYKVRIHNPKDFRVLGKVGKTSDLFGAWKWKTGGKTLVITAGEADALAAYTMLEAYRKSRNSDFEPTACVSAAVGESGSHKQFQEQYNWLNQWSKIIYFPDNDEAGQAALEKIALSLPKGKLFIGKVSEKDVNDMLVKGKSKQFISAYFEAKPYTPTGVVGSSSLFDSIVAASEVEKMAFPPFCGELNDALAGGLALGTIGVISAFTGISKSTLVNECLYHWLFNSPHKVAVVSMEQSKAQFGELILSRHMEVKLGKMLPEQKRAFLQEEATLKAQQEVFFTEDGGDRFIVIDDRDCEIESMKAAIERSIISCGAKVIVWDTISDSCDSLEVAEQATLMKWLKSMVNMYNCSFILIAHQRKPPAGTKDGSKGAMGTEAGVQGSSTITKSATWILMAARDKTAECPIERNTTYLELTKNREASTTGPVGQLYYDVDTHTLHDKKEWLKTQDISF